MKFGQQVPDDHSNRGKWILFYRYGVVTILNYVLDKSVNVGLLKVVEGNFIDTKWKVIRHKRWSDAPRQACSLASWEIWYPKLNYILINEFVMYKVIQLLILISCYRLQSQTLERVKKLLGSGLKISIKIILQSGGRLPSNIKTDEAQLILQQFNLHHGWKRPAMKMGYSLKRMNTMERYWFYCGFCTAQQNEDAWPHLVFNIIKPTIGFKDDAGNSVNKEILLKAIKGSHHYSRISLQRKNICLGCCVNETVSDSRRIFRNSEWYKICGEEYIAKAFQYAHRSRPRCVIDFITTTTKSVNKREKIFQLVKSLKGQAFPIHGLGLQGHWAGRTLRPTIG